jgi:tetratricopeptide (TPR) repeat protein
MKRSILKKVFILVTLLVATIGNFVFGQDLNSAILLTKSEQYDKAGEMLQQLIQKEPSNSKNHFFLGENYLLEYYSDTISNSFDIFSKNARDAFQKGVTANPNDPLNYVGLAKVAFFLGDDKTADEMRAKAKSFLLPYKNIKKISPPAKDYAFTLAKIAESYIREGMVDTSLALPLIRQAIKIDSKNPEIYLIAGDIYMTISEGSPAIKNYNLAQYYDPKSPTANMKIGFVYQKGRALTSAIDKFQAAIALDANYAPAYRELGQTYLSAQRWEQSKENYKKYLDLTAGNIPAKTRYINSLFFTGDYDEVILNVEEVLALDNSRTYMNRLAGYSYYERKNADYAKALFYMDELFKAMPEDRILPKDHHYAARILMKKNAGYTKMLDDAANLDQQLTTQRNRFNSASAADKAKLKPALDELTARTEKAKSDLATAQKEIERGFAEFNKVLEARPTDRAVMSEIATNYYNFRMYDKSAKALARLLDPAKFDADAYMRIGRAFYLGEKFKSADSVFNIILEKEPDNIPALIQVARTYSRMDPDSKMGLAKPKFEKVISVAQSDSVKNSSEIVEAIGYLGYYHMEQNNFATAKNYYNRMIALDPNNNDNKVKGYNGLGLIEIKMINTEKTNEGRLPYLSRAAEQYSKILAIEPNNASAKNQLNWIRDFESQVKKGINPNEIKGVVKDAATGSPIPYASIRVKDTAAEAMTNARGEYKFEIPTSSEILMISAKGYQAQEVPVTKSRIYNVSLSK